MKSKNITTNNHQSILVDIVPFYSIDTYFTYILDEVTEEFIGRRVLVPFKNRKIVGIILREHKETIDFDEEKLKKVIKVLDEKPIISSNMLELCKWISEYYVVPLGEVFKTVVPSRLKTTELKYIKFKGIQNIEKEILPTQEKKVVDFLLNYGKSTISKKKLTSSLKVTKIEQVLESLEKKGIINLISKGKGYLPQSQVVKINSKMFDSERFEEYLDILKNRVKLVEILEFLAEQLKQGITELKMNTFKEKFPGRNIRSYIKKLNELGFISFESKDFGENNTSTYTNFKYPNELQMSLNEIQEKVLNEIIKSIENQRFNSYLLFGVTGSGKTLIYMHCIKRCIQQGKSAILLVPEISLTPQLIERFNNAFPNQIAVLHSKLNESERIRQWNSILNGEKKIVIGARSAIFAPTKNLGIIIVDEEHEPTYKQEEPAPRYHARDVALIRGKIENCPVVLGSATPSVNSYYASKNGKHKLLVIEERADGAKLPNIFLVDLIEKRAQKKMFGQFSDALIHKIIDRLNRKEGIILFQNRRGFGLLVECRYCGYIPKCPECEVSLTFHKSELALKCHYCGYEKKYEPECPKCGKSPMMILGHGTQRIEEELKKILNEFGYEPIIERFDLDVVQKNPKQFELLEKFHRGEIDILVGTQLIAKGFDFERVTLVGIVNADLQLNIPDYSANERAFQLFTQVAGRSGRRSLYPGEVIIQTTSPKAYPIEAFLKQDYEFFYQKEIKFRKILKYPPFFRLVAIEIQWKTENLDQEILSFVESYLKNIENSILMGPVTPIIHKIRGWNRKVFLLKINRQKDPSLKATTSLLKKLNNDFIKKYHSQKLRIIIDVDAQYSLM